MNVGMILPTAIVLVMVVALAATVGCASPHGPFGQQLGRASQDPPCPTYLRSTLPTPTNQRRHPMTNSTNQHPPSGPHRRSTLQRVVPCAWLALSATWAAVIVVTDQVAWPLAIWFATTLGPLTAIERRHRHNETTHTNGAST